jgi:hypothetical protein
MRQHQTGGDPHAETRLRLLDLAEDASLYLRRSAEPSVRVAAALLLAASLAACSSSSETASPPPTPAVPALTQEVRQGLPTAPGIYPVSSNSITRDAQGVYGFSWRNTAGPATWNQGRASLVKLAQGTEDTLEIPQSGDPILRLKPDTPITLPDDAEPIAAASPQASGSPSTSRASTTGSSSGSSSSGSRSIAWYPFPVGGNTTVINQGSGSTGTGASTTTDTVAATTPAYRNPPAAQPGQGSVRGAASSLTAPTTSARTWTSPSRAAATGQAGGPGRGTAASSRSGSTASSSGASRPGSTGFSRGSSSGSSSSAAG